MEGIAGKYEQPKDNATVGYRVAECFVKIYVALADYDRARPYTEKLQLILKDNKPTLGITQKSDMHVTLASYYLATHQINEAVAHLKIGDSLVALDGSPVRKAVNENLWFRVDTAQGRYADAVHRLLKSKEINDSLFNATKSQQIHQLEVEFDTKKKEDQIRLLHQEARLEKVSLQQANLVKNVSFGGVVLALVIAGLLYRQNRIKQKNSRLSGGTTITVSFEQDPLNEAVPPGNGTMPPGSGTVPPVNGTVQSSRILDRRSVAI